MPDRIRTALTAGVVVLLAVATPRTPQLFAQIQAPQAGPEKLVFEVASVKRNTDPSPMIRGSGTPGDRFEATALPLHALIALAYGEAGTPVRPLPDAQLSGEPSWVHTDLFDVQAKAPNGVPMGNAGAEQKMLMLRTLLAERFKLAVHHETRELPIYALTLARSDGRLGSQLRQATVDCAALANPPPPPEPGSPSRCLLQIFSGGRMGAAGQRISTLTNVLANMTKRLVIDRTGLQGAFDFELQFNREGLPGLAPPPGVPSPVNNDLPSIYTALQEQLGLKLEPTRGPVDVLVIDHVERPTEN